LACAQNNFKTTSPFSEQSNDFPQRAAAFGVPSRAEMHENLEPMMQLSMCSAVRCWGIWISRRTFLNRSA
jgi:hypothetical protein